jgi:hypothetical protein
MATVDAPDTLPVSRARLVTLERAVRRVVQSAVPNGKVRRIVLQASLNELWQAMEDLLLPAEEPSR